MHIHTHTNSGHVDPVLRPVPVRGMSQRNAHARQQFFDAEGFGQVIVCAKLKTHHEIRLFGTSRQHNNGDRPLLSEPLANIKAGSGWQHNVEHNQIRLFALNHFQTLVCICGRYHVVTFFAQIVSDRFNDRRFVINHKHMSLR